MTRADIDFALFFVACAFGFFALAGGGIATLCQIARAIGAN